MPSFRFSSVLAVLIVFGVGLLVGRYGSAPPPSGAGLEPVAPAEGNTPAPASYVCPMHAEIVSGHEGNCPICGMALVAVENPAQHGGDAGRPAVRISPAVRNNFGVKLTTARKRTLVRRIEMPGFVQQIRKGRNTRYRAPLDGRIQAVHFKPDQWLEQGEPLFDFFSEALLQAQREHLGLLAAAGENATAPADGSGGDSAADVEASRQRLGRMGMDAAAIERLERTGEADGLLAIRAAHPGKVLGMAARPDEAVGKGSLLMELGGLVRASVLANAFQRDAVWIKSGQRVEVRTPHQGRAPWQGIVNQGSVSINPNTQNIAVRLSFSAPIDQVKSAMYVVATVYGEVREDVLAVPREAVMRGATEDSVIVSMGEGWFRPVRVRTGIETEEFVEVVDGLSEGDEVVVSSQFLIDSESSLKAGFQRLTETH